MGENFAVAMHLMPILIRSFSHFLSTLSPLLLEGPRPLANFSFWTFQIALNSKDSNWYKILGIK